MTKLPDEMYDVRKLERFLDEGLLTREQVDAWLAGLEDCADNADQSSVVMVSHHSGRRLVSSEEEKAEDDES